MKLRPRTFLIVAATSTAFMLGLIVVLPPMMLRSFLDLETRDARDNANRVAFALDETLSEMGTKVADWGSWDDTYKFIADHNRAFLKSNLTPATYDLLKIDVIAFLDTAGTIVYARQHDVVTKAMSPLSADLLARLNTQSPLLKGPTNDDRVGIVMLNEGPMLVASRPILTSEEKGPSRGTVVFGRRLSAQEQRHLAERTLLNVKLRRLGDPKFADQTAVAKQALSKGDSVTVRAVDGKTVEAIRVLRDVDDRPILLADVRLPRDIVAQGRRSVGTVLLWVLVAMLLMGAMTVLVVERAVLRRLMRLGGDVARVQHSQDPAQRVSDAGADELADLARGVNAMLTSIEGAQRDLLKTRDSAEAANRAKSQFLATMSHEIRTPMNGVLGMTTMLLQTPLSHEQRDYALLLNSAAESLLDLLNDVLDLSKIEADRMTLESVPFDLIEMLEDLAELMSVRAQERGVEVVIHVAAGAPHYVVGDPIRLRQVVLNLVGNAIKFTERGSVTIEVQGRFVREGQTLVQLNVTDTGAGIPPEVQARLFTPFAQADASTARRYGGTGLGLAISKRLVGLMGGTIQLVSQVGKGSTFGITLTMEPAKFPDARVPWPTPPAGRRVLVVDDLEASRAAMADALKSGDVEVVVATSGAEALQLLRSTASRFDAVVADAPLADMDSAKFVQAFQESPLASIPRVMLAAKPRPGGMAVAEAQGWAAYLPKPVRSALLLAAIEAITREPSARPTSIVTRHSIAEALQLPGISAPKRQAFKGVRVLIADDVRLNQVVAKHMLESMGCTVEVVDDGRQAVDRVKRGDLDVVFMDMHMPELDGPQATRIIRAWEVPPARIPILALSAGVMSDERAACFDAGMDEFVAKPIRPAELARALGVALQNRDVRAAA